jgi:hypothetical protein
VRNILKWRPASISGIDFDLHFVSKESPISSRRSQVYQITDSDRKEMHEWLFPGFILKIKQAKYTSLAADVSFPDLEQRNWVDIAKLPKSTVYQIYYYLSFCLFFPDR